jgi:alanine dehydrogenase
MTKIGILREGKTPPDERVVFTPSQISRIRSNHSELDIVVKRSEIRRIKDSEYESVGVPLVHSVLDCDILIGVKEVPIEELIPNKTYFFFSHTIKMQPYNRGLLKAVMDKGITLIDWECLASGEGVRIIGFGRYAGIVGAYNGFRALGLRDDLFDLKKAHNCVDREELNRELIKVKLPAMKILLTGGGKVARGALEILNDLRIKEVNIDEFLSKAFSEPVFCRITFDQYFKRKDGQPFDNQFYLNNPSEHVSDFIRFAKVADMFIAGHYWDSSAPFLFTREDARSEFFNINLVADISCDIDGPVASTLRPSTIEDPFYGYDPRQETETAFDAKGAITVMAVDNLPCEMPRDASKDFGEMFIEGVLPALINHDNDGVLAKGSITVNGKISDKYNYLSDWVED